MTKIKFDKCFTGNKKVSLEDMITPNGRLRREYDPDTLYCPLCKKARLKFTSATSQRVAYLSTWPGSIHKDGCRYSFEPIPKKVWKSYFDNLPRQKAKDILRRRVATLARQQHPQPNTNTSQAKDRDPLVIESQQTGAFTKYNIPLSDVRFIKHCVDGMEETPILFSGIAKIEILEYKSDRNDYNYHFLRLLDPETGAEYACIYNGGPSWKPKDIEKGKAYYCAFFGIYEVGRQRADPEIFPKYSHLFYYESVE